MCNASQTAVMYEKSTFFKQGFSGWEVAIFLDLYAAGLVFALQKIYVIVSIMIEDYSVAHIFSLI